MKEKIKNCPVCGSPIRVAGGDLWDQTLYFEKEIARLRRALNRLKAAVWEDRDGLCDPDLPYCRDSCAMGSTCRVMMDMGQ